MKARRHCQQCFKFIITNRLNSVNIYNDVVPYIELYLCQRCTDKRIKSYLSSEGEKHIRILPNKDEVKNIVIIGKQK